MCLSRASVPRKAASCSRLNSNNKVQGCKSKKRELKYALVVGIKILISAAFTFLKPSKVNE